jgi:hypothetical protein
MVARLPKFVSRLLAMSRAGTKSFFGSRVSPPWSRVSPKRTRGSPHWSRVSPNLCRVFSPCRGLATAHFLHRASRRESQARHDFCLFCVTTRDRVTALHTTARKSRFPHVGRDGGRTRSVRQTKKKTCLRNPSQCALQVVQTTGHRYDYTTPGGSYRRNVLGYSIGRMEK